jgi:hypothetical protein
MVGLGIGAVLLLMKDKEPEDPKAVAGASGTPASPAPPPAGTPVAGPEAPAATPPAPPPAPEKPDKPPGTSGVSVQPSKAEIKTYPHLTDTTADEQNKIDQAVQDALEGGGREARDGEVFLVKMDLKSAPALISQFKHVKDKHGLEGPEGLKRAMVVDRVLRRIDGVQERKFKDTKPINVNSDPKQTEATIKRWNWWWDTGAFKDRQKPWDPREDEKDTGGEDGG